MRKTLYLPSWVAYLLDVEGEKYDGPGVVAAASIVHFSSLKKREKVSVLKQYRDVEIEAAYKDEAVAGPLNEEHERTDKKRKGGEAG